MSLILKNKITIIHISIVIIWLAGTILAANYFISKRMLPFDPSDQLATIKKEVLLNRLVDQGLLESKVDKTVIHLTANDCACNKIPETHKSKLNKAFKSEAFTIVNSTLTTSLSDIVPAAPSIIIVDGGELVYLGPYSAGYSCSESNSFVDIAFNNHLEGYKPNLIVSDVDGCFCQV